MQKHVDSGEVKGGQVYFLAIKTLGYVFFSQDFGKLQKQCTGSTCRVIDASHLLLPDNSDSSQKLRHLLRGEELTTRLTCTRGIHRHQVFVSITESIDGVVSEITEGKIPDRIQQFHQTLVTFGNV